MSRKLRVLHVISSLEEGGAAKGAVELVGGLNASGEVDARLCVLGTNHRSVPTDRIPGGVKFLDSPVGRRSLKLRRWRQLRDIANEFRPDIVHSHLWPTAVDVSWALLGKSLPHVIHVRDSPEAFAERRWQSVLKKRLTAAAIRLNRPRPRLVAVSQAAADYTALHLRLPADQIQVLLNAVDLTEFVDTPLERPARADGRIVIGAAGRLVEPKGHRYLVEAVIRLRSEGLPVSLQIIGTGNQREALERQCLESGHPDAVTIMDYRPDVHRFYEQLDIYVLPSVSAEGLSRSLIEAMASGRPIVATDCEGTREVVRDQQDGLIVPVRDSAALAGAIRAIASDLPRRHRLGLSGRERAVKAFSIERVIREVIQLYRDFVAGLRTVR